MLKYAIAIVLISLARGQNVNGQSQVQQVAGGSDPYAFGQNQGLQAQTAYGQNQAGQTQSLAGQAMPGMVQTPGGIGQWQNPYMNYYQNQGMGAPVGGPVPVVDGGRRFYGGYGYAPAVAVGPPVLGPPVLGAPVMGPPVVGGYGGYPYYRK